MKSSTESLLAQFKVLADPVRARIVALCGVTECSVSELTKVMRQSQPRISQHLKQLCQVDLLERFKDGHFVFYRVQSSGKSATRRRRVLSLLPDDEPQFATDLATLRTLRGDTTSLPVTDADRSLYRALVELTVSRPLGDLIDIGCGSGKILKLLASRAQRVVGVDIDADARQLARAGLLLAGTPDITLRKGDMVALPFEDGEFDTVILDDVFAGADAQTALAAVREARRLLSADGRLLLLASVSNSNLDDTRRKFSDWAAAAKLRVTPSRPVPARNPGWLLAVASKVDRATIAA